MSYEDDDEGCDHSDENVDTTEVLVNLIRSATEVTVNIRDVEGKGLTDAAETFLTEMFKFYTPLSKRDPRRN